MGPLTDQAILRNTDFLFKRQAKQQQAKVWITINDPANEKQIRSFGQFSNSETYLVATEILSEDIYFNGAGRSLLFSRLVLIWFLSVTA